MRKQRLSPEQAFAAMAVFLERYHCRTGGKGDLAPLLGDLQVNTRDALPLDPGAWSDWLAAVNDVLTGHRTEQAGQALAPGQR